MSKILVVDDEESIRLSCYRLLTNDGHQVITAERGEQMLPMIMAQESDLVLLDIRLPDSDGISLLKSIPKEAQTAAVIYSAYIDQNLEKTAYAAGAVEVLRKDIGSAKFREQINKVLAAKEQLSMKNSEDKKTRKILIVDDEESIRNVLAEFFDSKGFKTLTAENGKEALTLVEKEHPSAVLLDVMMPVMDGIETLNKIRAIDPKVGVVMITGLENADLACGTAAMGAYHYVLKPFDLNYLELVVLTRIMIAA